MRQSEGEKKWVAPWFVFLNYPPWNKDDPRRHTKGTKKPLAAIAWQQARRFAHLIG